MPINGKKKKLHHCSVETKHQTPAQHNTTSERLTNRPLGSNSHQQTRKQHKVANNKRRVVRCPPSKKTIDGKERKIQQQSRVFLAKEKMQKQQQRQMPWKEREKCKIQSTLPKPSITPTICRHARPFGHPSIVVVCYYFALKNVCVQLRREVMRSEL